MERSSKAQELQTLMHDKYSYKNNVAYKITKNNKKNSGKMKTYIYRIQKIYI